MVSRSWRCHAQRTPAGETMSPRFLNSLAMRTWPNAGARGRAQQWPPTVAELGSLLGRTDDIGKQNSREHPVARHQRTGAGQKLLDRIGDLHGIAGTGAPSLLDIVEKGCEGLLIEFSSGVLHNLEDDQTLAGRDDAIMQNFELAADAELLKFSILSVAWTTASGSSAPHECRQREYQEPSDTPQRSVRRRSGSCPSATAISTFVSRWCKQ